MKGFSMCDLEHLSMEPLLEGQPKHRTLICEYESSIFSSIFNNYLIEWMFAITFERYNKFDKTLFSKYNYTFCIGNVGQYILCDVY